MGRERKPDDEPTANSSWSCTLKLKSLTYDESYLSFGFMSVIIKSEERSQCVLCVSSLATDSMKPNTLKWHLETKHLEMKNKRKEYSDKKLRIWKKSSVNTTTV
jgi:hypothetical protein